MLCLLMVGVYQICMFFVYIVQCSSGMWFFQQIVVFVWFVVVLMMGSVELLFCFQISCLVLVGISLWCFVMSLLCGLKNSVVQYSVLLLCLIMLIMRFVLVCCDSVVSLLVLGFGMLIVCVVQCVYVLCFLGNWQLSCVLKILFFGQLLSMVLGSMISDVLLLWIVVLQLRIVLSVVCVLVGDVLICSVVMIDVDMKVFLVNVVNVVNGMMLFLLILFY